VKTLQTFVPADVRRRFDAAAARFADHDFVHATTREGLFARLEPMLVDGASLVVDLGCAAGAATRPLAQRFRGARILGLDLSRHMLVQARSARGWFTKASFVQAEATALPLADQSVDVVFSNLLLPWIADPADVATEVARVLAKGGLFAFATLGPDSLLAIRRAWQRVDDEPHVAAFPDMHDLGDTLVRAGLADPVLDVDRLTVSYPDSRRLFDDLTAAGARNALAGRRRTLTGCGRFESMRRGLDRGGEPIRIELELVYGHCWGPGPRSPGGDVRIDAASIPLRRNRG
jgi:malonyl-CoA O-methyltransferase